LNWVWVIVDFADHVLKIVAFCVIDWIKGKGGGVSFFVRMIFEFIIFVRLWFGAFLTIYDFCMWWFLCLRIVSLSCHGCVMYRCLKSDDGFLAKWLSCFICLLSRKIWVLFIVFSYYLCWWSLSDGCLNLWLVSEFCEMGLDLNRCMLWERKTQNQVWWSP